jgi:Fic family protein
MEFFLDGVAYTADQAFETARQIANLFETDKARISAAGDRAATALHIFDLMRTRPFLTASGATKLSKLTLPTVNATFERLVKLGILQEITGKKRGRVFAYKSYVDILNEGTQPL